MKIQAYPIVYLITDGEITGQDFTKKSRQTLDLIRIAVKSGVSLVQIREKKITPREVFDLTYRAVEITRGTETRLLVNDRFDIALAANADGVHLSSKSIPAKHVRQNSPPGFLIGVSTHNSAEIEVIKKYADFVTFSPIFATASKNGHGRPQGILKLNEVCEKHSPFPIVALGGIDEANYFDTIEAGACGIAAIRLLNNVERLSEITNRIKTLERVY
jgi:thiamine-phosphate pyrophosphorylase